MASSIGSQRKFVQWLCTLLLLAIPFLRIGGDSLLRLDAASRTLLFFGARVRIEEFYLFLIVVLILVFGFLLVTMLFGRVWCGWLCPQTTLCDLAEWFDTAVGSLVTGKFLSALLRHLGYLLLSLLIAANLIWYFIPPAEFFRRLGTGETGMVAGTALSCVLLLLYLDLTLVRRSFCKTVCPYGRLQLMTMDQNTLILTFDANLRPNCLQCGACTRVCPMGIDIKDGLQIECINCGRCLDACREVMERRGGQKLIHYSFGAQATGTPWNRKVFGYAVLLAALGMLLAIGIGTRKEATVKVQRSAGGAVRTLPDGSLVNFYSAFLENRSTRPEHLTLTVAPIAGMRSEIIGTVREVLVQPNANLKVDFAVRIAPAPATEQQLRLQLLLEGKLVETATLPVLVR